MLQQFLILSDLTVFSAERQVRKEKTADYKPFGTVLRKNGSQPVSIGGNANRIIYQNNLLFEVRTIPLLIAINFPESSQIKFFLNSEFPVVVFFYIVSAQ